MEHDQARSHPFVSVNGVPNSSLGTWDGGWEPDKFSVSNRDLLLLRSDKEMMRAEEDIVGAWMEGDDNKMEVERKDEEKPNSDVNKHEANGGVFGVMEDHSFYSLS